MFEEDSYEHLAELYINLNDCPLNECLYCLCSRAILRPGGDQDDKYIQDYLDSSVREEDSTIRFLNSSTESQPSTVVKKKEHDEGVSCYCSTSHCSTDDSTRDALYSDSGADLSEASRDPDWEDYWAKNGESIIWASWIERYGEYVDPAYIKESKQQPQSSPVAYETLSEVSHEHSDATRLSFGSEVSDSFTNVTPLTLSELSTEESSLLSSSDSAGSMSADAAQWQALWINHFNIQYQLAYENYKTGLKKQEELSTQYNDRITIEEILSEQPEVQAGPFISRRPDKKRDLELNSVGFLLNHLKSFTMDQDDSNVLKPEEIEVVTEEGSADIDSETKVSDLSAFKSEEMSSNDIQFEPTQEQPQTSMSSESYEKTEPSSDVLSEPTSDVRSKLKRPHDRDDDRLRGAFNLIGLSYNGEGVSSGTVYYKKRNIRWQNRMLHMNLHIHFDEEGQIITKDKKTEKKTENNDAFRLTNTSEVKSDFSEKDDSSDGELFSASEECDTKKERKKKRRRRKGLPKEIIENERLLKFWYQRYRLFSKFDEGIKLDEESWYSVSPEKVSRHTAERCRCDVIIDACCGAGGNTIQFAFTCERVIAIDIDPMKIEIARHNARIYGVEDRIEFIVGDFIKLAPELKADVVFLSPPWGGLNYASEQSYHLDKILPPIGGAGLFEISSRITSNIAMYLPKNVNSDDMLRLAGSGGNLELEQNFLGKKLIAVTAYFGELVGSYQEPQ